MNKVFLFALLTFASFAEVNAQLKVDANGKVKIASNQIDSISLLTVGNNAYTASPFSNGIISSPIIKNGSTVVKTIEGATITKDFEVKNGAELVITNE
jgi:uncharacterized protein with FMN-binding domain